MKALAKVFCAILALSLAMTGTSDGAEDDHDVGAQSRILVFGTGTPIDRAAKALVARGERDVIAVIALAMRYRRYHQALLQDAFGELNGSPWLLADIRRASSRGAMNPDFGHQDSLIMLFWKLGRVSHR